MRDAVDLVSLTLSWKRWTNLVDSSAAYTHAAQYKRKKKPMMAMPAMYMPAAWLHEDLVRRVKRCPAGRRGGSRA